jgi:membrane protease YdiL (CAAX protease family)
MEKKTPWHQMDLDLWKRDAFRIKDAVLLCLFLTGVRFIPPLLFYFFRVNSPAAALSLVYDLVLLGIVLIMLKYSGKDELKKIMKWRKIPAALFFSLLVMYFGLEIIRRELGNIVEIVFPMPERIFDLSFHASVFTVFVSNCFFPAVSEELFFRGIVLKRLRRNYPRRTALVVSSLLFGLMHLNPWQGLLAAVGGLFFGWIYLEFKTIWLCMFMHGYNNLLASFVPFPIRYLPNRRTYAVLVMHPLWFDVFGAALLVFGFFLTWEISRHGRRKA